MKILTKIRSRAAACVFLVLGATPVLSQIEAERTYYGIDRQIAVNVNVPVELAGEARIDLYAAPKFPMGEPVASAEVGDGRADLSALLPVLWDAAEGQAPPVYYAQLAVGETDVGAPLVIQPMVTPAYARPAAGNRPPSFTRAGMVFSGYRIYKEQVVVLDTTKGEIVLRLRPDQAPNTVWNFMHLVEGGFYTDIFFHRVLGPGTGNSGFVIQVGDPTASGAGGPGYMIDLEDSNLPHDRGVLSMARSNDPNSNGSQVFICLSRQRTQALDKRYTAFGETLMGDEPITLLGDAPVGDPRSGRPTDEAGYRLISARLRDAAPMSEAPAPITAESDRVDR